MRIQALGPIELRTGERAVPLGGPKPKALLAALLLQPRQVVSVERLIALIWDDAPPRSATALVHTYISQLRRAFGEAGNAEALVTRPPGYLLDVTADDCDLDAFEQLIDKARQAERRANHAEANERYEQALRLWRGPAFGGVDTTFARTSADALDEDRLGAAEGRARCLLELGRGGEVVASLTQLVNASPLREEARGLLMRALYEGGRHADALAVYRDGRRHLQDELGMEPGEKLKTLHTEILNGSLSVKKPSTPADVPAPRQQDEYVVPRHLPPDIGDFTGRAEHLGDVLRLAGQSTVDTRTATPTVVISGFGGAGKSALAVHAAHLLRGDYPDGQLFADLRGSERDLEAQEVLGRFLGALGISGNDLPDTLDDRVDLYRRKVAGRRLVIVLDNARGEHQVRRLLPGDPHCLVIITSRSRLTGLEGIAPIELDFFSTEAAVDMLRKIIGPARVAAEPEAAHTIVSLCGGVPLAIRAAAAKLLARPHWPLRALASRLSDERRRLDELAVGDLAIRSSLRLNYAELDDRHRRAFHLLALFDLPDFGLWLAAPLLEVSLEDAEDIVERLVDLRLLDVVGIDPLGRVRYRFHDLVQLFGAEQAETEPPELVAAALSRALATWMALVEAGAKRLPRVTLGLRPKVETSVVTDPRLIEEAEQNPTEWLKSETAAVVRAVERAHELGIDEVTTTLITALLSSPFAARNEFDGWQRTHEVALAAARKSGDLRSEASVLAGLGQLFYEKDDFATALDHFQLAKKHALTVGDDATLAVALVGIGTVRRDLAQFEQALADLDEAAELAERIGDDTVLAAARYGAGAISRDHGDLAAAAGSFESCVTLYRELGDRRGEALALRALSLCHRANGKLGEAVELSREAEIILDDVGDALGAAYARQSLAKARIRQREVGGVAELLDSCLEVCAQHRDRFGVALMTRTAGELALARGELDRASELLTIALGQWTELDLPLWRARTLRDLAAAVEDGRTRWAEALTLFASTGARELAELAAHTPLTWRNSVSIANL
ncbi:BTAD domain-containing putative transcriptional regulator [Amycolatopsis sp. cg5]|uniref:AfsR/SARP family transcriptional regulator n=1 Tax=Amycolatopsis sp. cg5 TaxID=3238802 RepID=UPI003524F95C